MRRAGAIAVIMALAWPCPTAAGDSGDDFSNNLFTDLAPLLALFGEQFAKQFMSQSMSWVDHIIFAMAPLGILTAIVAAIRVGGPPWLRAVVGRARENRATVEVELMSSTSHEVCELWNGEGIVRTMGQPQLGQIIYFEENRKDPKTFGLHTLESMNGLDAQVESAEDSSTATPQHMSTSQKESDLPQPVTATRSNRNPSAGLRLRKFARRGASPDEEIALPAQEISGPLSAPNLSLNIHGGSRIHELYAAALCGIILQFGVLVFCGYSVYHPGFSTGFSKNGQKVRAYAYPVMATGTVILAIGMAICSYIVEASTEEMVYRYSSEATGNTSTGDEEGQRSDPRVHILWLQKSHVVSDQKFDSHVIFRPAKSGPRNGNDILTSRRNTKEEPYLGYHGTGSPRTWQKCVRKIVSTRTEFITILGVILGLVGFVLQFQGLRGMNWSASVAQLMCIFLMTVWRAWVRRGLIAIPISKKVLEDHEMDWLALKIVKGQQSRDGDFWPSEEPLDLTEHLSWKISLGHYNLAHAGSWGSSPSNGVEPRPEPQTELEPELRSESVSQLELSTKQATDALHLRRRLGQLTKWTGQTSLPSISVASSIEIVMNTLFSDEKHEVFLWSLGVEVDGEGAKIPLRIVRTQPGGKWETKATLIEAALSLWVFHIHSAESTQSTVEDKGAESDWLRHDVGLKRKAVQILGPAEPSETLQRDIKWWVGDVKYANIESVDQLGPGFTGPLGFVGIESLSPAPDTVNIESQASLESSLAQHIFSSFMWAIAKHIPATAFNRREENSISHGDLFRADDPSTLRSLRFQNDTIAGMAGAIQQAGLGSLREVSLCIIPALSSLRKLPAEAMIDFVRRQMREYEILGRWGVVVPGYIKLFQECKPFGPSHHVTRLATAILIDLLRCISNALELQESQLRMDALEELAGHKEKISKELQLDKDSPCELMKNFIRLRVLQRQPMQGLPTDFALKVERDKDVHDYFGHHSVFSTIMDLHTAFVNEGSTKTDVTDIFGWTPLHYAAVRGDVDLVRRLMEIGADPNVKDLAEWTPLHYAIEASGRKKNPVRQGELESIIRTLLEHGADTEIRGRDGVGPIHCAAIVQNSSVGVLLLAGANPGMQDNCRKTALHWAASSGNISGISELLRRDISGGAQDNHGRIPLHLAAVSGRLDAARKLLEYEQNGSRQRDAVDRDGRTPLHLTAMKGDKDMINLLLGGGGHQGKAKERQDSDNRADNNAIYSRDNRGCTPLDLSIIFGKEKEAVQALLGSIQMSSEIRRGLKAAVLFARPEIVKLIGLKSSKEAIEAILETALDMKKMMMM